jgi:hypothetical protein
MLDELLVGSKAWIEPLLWGVQGRAFPIGFRNLGFEAGHPSPDPNTAFDACKTSYWQASISPASTNISPDLMCWNGRLAATYFNRVSFAEILELCALSICAADPRSAEHLCGHPRYQPLNSKVSASPLPTTSSNSLLSATGPISLLLA